MSKFTRCMALMVLALWGLAAMHCKLEAVPGMDFLQTCCFADSSSPCQQDCQSDGCSAVEDAKYRAEEQSASAPQPLLIVAQLSTPIETPLPESQAHPFAASKLPPELPRSWQFCCRAALLPRAPSLFD